MILLHIVIYTLILFILAYIAISMNEAHQPKDVLRLSTKVILLISALSIIILYFAPNANVKPIINPEVGTAVDLAGAMAI